MQINRYGIALKRLSASDIELVRQWRNDPKIAQHMFYKVAITPEQQRDWFLSVNNVANFFFLIQHHQQPVGLINISSIDWDKGTAYTGLFIYDDHCLSSDVPVMASLAMLDTFFLVFGLQKVYAKVKGDNQVAHQYNTTLGFSRTKKIELGQGYEYELSQENYLVKAQNLRQAAVRLKGNQTTIEFHQQDEVNEFLKEKLIALPETIIKSLKIVLR
jgi:UDP-4-amino-4,6-dideoxy-N-acetyl-beta-L-altrosamine N-acetyltransferase